MHSKFCRSAAFFAAACSWAAPQARAVEPIEPTLLGRARKIAPLSAWKEGFGRLMWDRKGNSYYWISQSQLLLFRFAGVREDRDIWRLSRRDAASGREVPLPALSARFNESRGVHGWHSVSPDGQRLLWMGFGYHVAMLDGSRYVSWPGVVGSSTVSADWLGDSRHWIEGVTKSYAPDMGLLRHSVDRPREQKWLRSARADPFAAPALKDFIGPTVTHDGHLVATSEVPPEGLSRIRVVKASIQVGPAWRARQQMSVVQAPRGWLFDMRGEPSPSGNRIAWLCRSAKPLGHKNRVRSGVWVSRLDGKQMRLIGTIEAGTYDGPYKLRWVPGQKRLSFEFRDVLYTVPA